MNKTLKNVLLTCGCVLVLSSGGYYFYNQKTTSSNTQTASITYSVIKGDLSKTVTASGNLEASQSVNLSFTGNAKVTKVYVAAGDVVTKGQVLAQMDATTLQNALLSAQANYDSAVARQKSVAEGTDESTLSEQQYQVSKAKSDVATAKTALSAAKKVADSVYLQSQVDEAKKNVISTQTQLDKAKAGGNTSEILFAQVAYENAQSAYKQAISQRNSLETLKNQVTQAQNTVDNATRTYNQAVSKLTELQKGPEESEVVSAKASVAQALANLNDAKTNLEGAKIVAPFNGMISSVSAKEGESMSGNASAVSMFSTEGSYQISTSIDDTDVTDVAVGQEVDITFDALTGITLKGKVVSKAVLGEVQTTGTVTFPIVVEVTAGQENADKLIPGLGATLAIITDGKQGVIQVPDAAIKSFGGKKIVMVEKDGKEVQTEITTGLDDGANTEVLTGLNEGDQVKITITTTTSSETTTQSGFNLNGLGGTGGGGNFPSGGTFERPSGGSSTGGRPQ